MAASHESNLPAAGCEGPSPAQELELVVYERCIIRHLRVLDAKITRLELQLNDEMERICSCSGLLEDITKPYTSSCSELREEIDKTRTKRDRIYQEFQRNQQQIPGNDK